MPDEATEITSLDASVEAGVEAALNGSEFESADELTTDDELVALLMEPDDEDGWGSDEEIVEEPEPSAEAPAVYTVKVDGEEIEVTLDELLGGYQRQSDYTRKTQALASEREELNAFRQFNEQLRVNPEGTLKAVAAQLGIDLGTPAPATPEVEEFVDPLEAKVRELESTIGALTAQQQAAVQAQQEAARLAAVDAELDAVRAAANDPDFNDTAVLQFAVDNQIGSLDVAYKAMKALAAQEASASEQARIEAAKRQLPPVEGGRARSAGSTRVGPAGGYKTVESALMAALNGS